MLQQNTKRKMGTKFIEVGKYKSDKRINSIIMQFSLFTKRSIAFLILGLEKKRFEYLAKYYLIILHSSSNFLVKYQEPAISNASKRKIVIDVTHHIGWLGLNARQFSRALWGSRNLIHPYEQMASKMYPDVDTFDISWLVVQAAVNYLARALKND